MAPLRDDYQHIGYRVLRFGSRLIGLLLRDEWLLIRRVISANHLKLSLLMIVSAMLITSSCVSVYTRWFCGDARCC